MTANYSFLKQYTVELIVGWVVNQSLVNNRRDGEGKWYFVEYTTTILKEADAKVVSLSKH